MQDSIEILYYLSAPTTLTMDAYHSIDYDKSIAKQKLIYTINIRTIWSFLACYLSALAFWIMIFALSCELFADKERGIFYFPLLPLLVGMVTLCWIIINLILLNSFIKIDGMEKDINKNDMIATLYQYYKLNNLDATDENIVRDVKPYRFLHGRIITCLLDNKKVYLNITSVQNLNSLSPFHGLYNYYKCKRIAKKFKELQANQ